MWVIIGYRGDTCARVSGVGVWEGETRLRVFFGREGGGSRDDCRAEWRVMCGGSRVAGIDG